MEGESLDAVALASTWQARLGPGCELVLKLSSGRELWVIRTEIASVEEEIAGWKARLGARVARTKEVASWPLAPAGRQITLDVTLGDGFRFEGDLIEMPPGVKPETELETEWVFEGTPGVEMGETQAKR